MVFILGTVRCGEPPQPSPVARAPQHLPAEPDTGLHYAKTAWASVHRDGCNSDYVPLAPSAAVVELWRSTAATVV